VPVVLSPVTYRNYGGGCGAPMPSWVDDIVKSDAPARPAGPALLRYREIEALGDSVRRPYIHVPAITFDAIDVSFDALSGREERRYSMDLPTSFVLPDEAVDRLHAVGGRLLRESRSYRNFLKQAAADSAAPR